MADLQPIVRLFGQAGWSAPAIPEAAHLVAYGQTLASVQSLSGVRVQADTSGIGIEAQVVVGAGGVVAQPIHLCLGLFEAFGAQDVQLALTLEPGAQATLWAHGLFETPLTARHTMRAEIRLMDGAVLHHQEPHYHGRSGDIVVSPHARVHLERGAHYLADFSLLHGRVGGLDIDYVVTVGEGALAELTSRVYGFADDLIHLRERLDLDGAGARALVKSRVAVRDDTRAEVFGIVEGNAAGARGHVDCMEVVRDRAIVGAVPEVRVRHPQAKVTHEAAIGSVDSRQLETLMARGLAPDDAVDLIVRGMLV
jgi:hypothetical protein